MSEDDRTPMLEHEMDATILLDSNDSPAAGVKYRRRSMTLLLAAVTFILLSCALIFLIVSLIVPILHSLDAKHIVSGNTSSPATDDDHAAHSTHHATPS